ncbi:hypothetical protein HDU96_006047 [Phlyctochytrium bullatum]|nr:hypothetical protein HDU96_006047 [Phlyctochytrium bullatum]
MTGFVLFSASAPFMARTTIIKFWGQAVPTRTMMTGDSSGYMTLLDKRIPTDECTNVTESILNKVTKRLHLSKNHPLNILKNEIETYFKKTGEFKVFDSLNPAVSAWQNFDALLIPPNHPSRSPSDTYYINTTTVLRTHTSAHQMEVLKTGSSTGYLVTADVYRRDEIDTCHYPVFHQMEGIRLFPKQTVTEATAADAMVQRGAIKVLEDEIAPTPSNPLQPSHDAAEALAVVEHLKGSLEGLVKYLLRSDPNVEIRWIEGSFPFTSPSFELEVRYMGKWLELCGCGVIQQQILDASGTFCVSCRPTEKIQVKKITSDGPSDWA